MAKIKSLSIFFPCLNDSLILPQLIKKANLAASKLTTNYEIIVINDGSTDSSGKVLVKLKKRYPKLRLINHSKNQGYGATLRDGFKNAKKEWVFYTDGDGQYDPAEMTSLLKKIGKGVDVVNGYKLIRNDLWFRKLIGGLYNKVLHVFYRLPISDVDCDFRLIKRIFLKKINLTSTSGVICLELIVKLKKAGARFSEVGVHHYSRPYGKSQFFRMKNVLKTGYEGIRFYLSR